MIKKKPSWKDLAVDEMPVSPSADTVILIVDEHTWKDIPVAHLYESQIVSSTWIFHCVSSLKRLPFRDDPLHEQLHCASPPL